MPLSRSLVSSILSFALFILSSLPALAGDLAKELPQMVGKNADLLARGHGETLKVLTSKAGPDQTAPEPWHVWKVTEPELRYVVFSGRKLFTNPGEVSASIHLLSENGAEIGAWGFAAGYRMDLAAARIAFDKKLQAQIITVATAPTGTGIAAQIFSRHHFAIVDDQLYFIRMEDRNGKLVRNTYWSPSHTLGGELPAKDVTGWSLLLTSPKPVLRLAALTYLAGFHVPRSGLATEGFADPSVAIALRNAPATKKKVQEYRGSNNIPWLKEAADLAASKSPEGE